MLAHIHLNAAYLKAALLAASTEESRYHLCGVHVEPRMAGEMFGATLVATDGAVLFAAADMPGYNAATVANLELAPLAESIIIPSHAVKRALQGYRGENVDLWQTGKRDWILGDVAFNPVDGCFPEWRRVVPTSASGEAAAFDGDRLATVYKMFRAATGARKPRGNDIGSGSRPWLRMNGGNATAVDFYDPDCFAVIMPLRPPGEDPAPFFDSVAHVASKAYAGQPPANGDTVEAAA